MKKLLLSGICLVLTVLFSYGQSTLTGTSYTDDFNDNVIAASATDGWYNSGVYALTETSSQLQISATNADQFFSGFGLFLKPTTMLNITANKKASLYITNNHATASIELRLDLKLVDAAFTGTNCPAALGDTLNANFGVTTTIVKISGTGTPVAGADAGGNTVVIPAGVTAFVTFNYTSAGYEYNTACGGVWTPTTYTISTYIDVVGLYAVINGGAGEGWCATTDGSCDLFTGSISVDNLKIGGTAGVAATNRALDNISVSKLYPNPVSEIANIELSLKSSEEVKVTLTDMVGREVAVIAEGTMISLDKSFNVSTLTKGLYTVNYFINGAPAKAELLMVK